MIEMPSFFIFLLAFIKKLAFFSPQFRLGEALAWLCSRAFSSLRAVWLLSVLLRGWAGKLKHKLFYCCPCSTALATQKPLSLLCFHWPRGFLDFITTSGQCCVNFPPFLITKLRKTSVVYGCVPWAPWLSLQGLCCMKAESGRAEPVNYSLPLGARLVSQRKPQDFCLQGEKWHPQRTWD